MINFSRLAPRQQGTKHKLKVIHYHTFKRINLFLKHVKPSIAVLATGSHHVRSAASHWHHMFRQNKCLSHVPLTKEETGQLKRANEGWGRRWRGPAVSECRGRRPDMYHRDPRPAVSPPSSVTAMFFCPMLFNDSSGLMGAAVGGKLKDVVPLSLLHHLHLLCAIGWVTRWKWRRIKSTNPTHTVVQHKYKHYEKCSPFYTKCEGASATGSLFLGYELLIFTLDVNHGCVVVFTTVVWYWWTFRNIWDRTDALH